MKEIIVMLTLCCIFVTLTVFIVNDMAIQKNHKKQLLEIKTKVNNIQQSIDFVAMDVTDLKKKWSNI